MSKNAQEKLPKHYRRLNKSFPQYMEAVRHLGEVAQQEGPLDIKSLQLIQLAAAAAIRSEGSVHSHARRALVAGAAPDEIRHALIALTSTLGFPTVSAALSWAEEMIAD